MRNFKNFVFMSEKTIRLERFLCSLFYYAAHNRLKNLTTAVNATRHATRILLGGLNQKLFFLHKTCLI